MQSYKLTFFVLIILFFAGACSPAAAPTEEPEAVAPTEVPTTEPTAQAATDIPATAAGETATDEAEPTPVTDAESQSASESTDEVTCPAGNNITVTLAIGQVGLEGEMAIEAAEAYEILCPNVSVEFEDTSDSATEREDDYKRRLALGDETLDIIQIDVISVGILAENLLPLNDYIEANFANTQFPSMIQAATVGESVYALPWLIDTGHLYYRTDLLEKYDLDVPQTWDDLQNAAAIIMQGERSDGNSEFWGFVWQGNIGENLTTNALEWQVSHGGGRIMSDICEVNFNRDEFVDAMERVQSWLGDISPTNVLEMREEESRAVWNAGNAAFMRNWFYAYDLSNGADSAIAGNFDITKLPTGPTGESAATLGGQMVAISRHTTNPEAAVAVARYLTSQQEQKRRALATSLNPTYPELYEDPELLERYPPYPDLLNTFLNAATPRPSAELGTSYNSVSELYYETVYSILDGSESASSGARTFVRTLENSYLQDCGD